jgi:cytosine/adenosine deaminase-related metal-dependent hydrolase
MKFFSSSYVFPVSSAPIRNGVVVLSENDQVMDIFDPLFANFEQEAILSHPNLHFQKGFITPGFINTHCHLELSHLRGKLKAGDGLDEFIRELEKHRKTDLEEILDAQRQAESEMIRNGIVGVGDISNGRNSFDQKMKSRLHYHTFIEVFSIKEAFAEDAFGRALQLFHEFHELLRLHKPNRYNTISISPHAPYSASAKLLKLINLHAIQNHSLLSIHNQENQDENLFFKEKKGKISERLGHFGIEIGDWQPTGMNSMQSALQYLPRVNRMLLVHNTVTTLEDRIWAEDYSEFIYWGFCPGANLYIENMLPDFTIFKNVKNCTLGTDSLASNTELSILSEMNRILIHSGIFSFEELLQWATINGARFLGYEGMLGSIEIGKNPGLNILDNIDERKLSITPKTTVKNLLS